MAILHLHFSLTFSAHQLGKKMSLLRKIKVEEMLDGEVRQSGG